MQGGNFDMSIDMIKEYKFTINGLPIEATYHSNDINKIFIPLLEKLTKIQNKLNRRIVVFIAAAPGTGKSTLSTFLEKLSKENCSITPIQSVGLDGFHYDNNYLISHHIDNDLSKPFLITIKGSKETFNITKLKEKLSTIQEDDCYWPTYSRTYHDVIDNAIKIEKDIVILEGNYLLLNIDDWASLRQYADYTVFVYSDKSLLKDRLIQRKKEGGSNQEEANIHFNNVDSKNIDIVLDYSNKADLNLYLNSDLSYTVMP